MKKYIFLVMSIMAGVGYWQRERIFFTQHKSQISPDIYVQDNAVPERQEEIKNIEEWPVMSGDVFGQIMARAGVATSTANAIYTAAQPVYDLAKINVGRSFFLNRDYETGDDYFLLYRLDTEDELVVCRSASSTSEGMDNSQERNWQARIRPIPYEVKIQTAHATVESSMYQAALDNDIDIRAIIALADAFGWEIDFALDPRAGDTFAFAYEARYLEGKFIMPGQVLGGVYNNAGERFEVYYFTEDEQNRGFYDENGHSAQRMFLKAPVAFKYISSGFTTGLRYIQAFNISTGHRAIDYAATLGTPVRAVGDGTVVLAAWEGSYGRKISIRHNGTYSTNYAHLSGFAVKRGDKVKQGQVIGYVGSTGLSTGPHLHYEMVKNGVKINPLKEVLPPGEPIKAENKDRFVAEINRWQELLNLE